VSGINGWCARSGAGRSKPFLNNTQDAYNILSFLQSVKPSHCLKINLAEKGALPHLK
jgi:hypothetical protein